MTREVELTSDPAKMPFAHREPDNNEPDQPRAICILTVTADDGTGAGFLRIDTFEEAEKLRQLLVEFVRDYDPIPADVMVIRNREGACWRRVPTCSNLWTGANRANERSTPNSPDTRSSRDMLKYSPLEVLEAASMLNERGRRVSG